MSTPSPALALAALAACSGLDRTNLTPTVEPPTQTALGPCATASYNGQSYDCAALDPCDASQASILPRLACCECDPTLCNAPPAGACPTDTGVEVPPTDVAETCMACHNGSGHNDYLGDGLGNPHPFGAGTAYLRCTTCHGGDGAGAGADGSHVPRPPEIGDDLRLIDDPAAYFAYLTRTGIERYPDWVDGAGRTWTALDYVQFLNPGDLRAVSAGRGCGAGGCHAGEHATWVPRSPIGLSQGIASSALFTVGAPNAVPAQRGLYGDTAADYAMSAAADPGWVYDPANVGPVGEVLALPERAVYGGTGLYDNPVYSAALLETQREVDNLGGSFVNQVVAGSALEDVVIEGVALACGDCHAGSAGANARYGDFRSSGCTVCHMRYALDGQTAAGDERLPVNEPADPDAIAAPERPHVKSHQVANVAKFYPTATGPAFVAGVTDEACAGCHAGSNRTVLQYWGIRPDPNRDVVRGVQYPANPVSFATTAGDPRLFDLAAQNATFNGATADQLLLEEDYDGDGRDDTPPDAHYEAGLGCIDCHGSRDLHAGTAGDPTSGALVSRMDQTVGVRCTSCHGTVEAIAGTVPCTDYAGANALCAVDAFGNALRNVVFDGARWLLVSRIDGATHVVPQTRDTVVDNGALDGQGQRLYSPNASYAMGRADGDPATGLGPVQGTDGLVRPGFSHLDTVGCDACHAAWTNNCVGCHLQVQYDDNPANAWFSHTTGERIAVFLANFDVTYASPVGFGLEVSTRGVVGAGQPGMSAFWRYQDLDGGLASGLVFSDRVGSGANPGYGGRDAFPAMSHNKIYAHSIRGRVTADAEGVRQCVACHLDTAQLATWGDGYAAYVASMAANDFGALDFDLLAEHLGRNTGNALNSPYFVHAAVGLGSGLLLFDAQGCPVNPLDTDPQRAYCQGVAPAYAFDPANVAYDLDGVVEPGGTSNASRTRPLTTGIGPLRAGAQDPWLAGPLGGALLSKLADPVTGLVLDGWLDADGVPQGTAPLFVH